MWEEYEIGWNIMSKKITVTNNADLQSVPFS
jgi:hypothetical protein